jgi:hypothetical protein
VLPFRIQQLCVGKLHLLLLPKMTKAQMEVISKRLTRAGYSVEHSGPILARSSHSKIHIDPSGLCRSTTDIDDLVIPAIPDILSLEKQPVPIGDLKSLYLTTGRTGRKTTIRVSTRLESWNLWESMRASDSCGLSPDEHAVSSFLFEHARGVCEVVTDFAEEGSVIRMLGRRRYFDSKIDPSMAATTLRVVGTKSARNSYLPRDGMLGLASFENPSAEDWIGLFKELGEWCYFIPK